MAEQTKTFSDGSHIYEPVNIPNWKDASFTNWGTKLLSKEDPILGREMGREREIRMDRKVVLVWYIVSKGQKSIIVLPFQLSTATRTNTYSSCHNLPPPLMINNIVSSPQ